MERTYEVLLTMRVHGEWRELGRFYLGEDPEQANATFRRLKGQPGNNGWIRMELREARNQRGPYLGRINCTLDELAENCRMITKEAFKRFNLEHEPVSGGARVGEFLHLAGFGPF
ncbi:hypothetical protein ACFPMF_02625 [Larkinella bovis]|uniref:Uncharacterized protein n=1 Tax=Larkinella bovis TaxID=683041 RepID=A0ABW0I3U5_9BACT